MVQRGVGVGKLLSVATIVLLVSGPAWAARDVSFQPATPTVEAYDFAEVVVNVAAPDAANPFTDVTLSGSFGRKGEAARTAVEGFCDAA